MFGGSVQGVFREVQPAALIVLDWRFRWAPTDGSGAGGRTATRAAAQRAAGAAHSAAAAGCAPSPAAPALCPQQLGRGCVLPGGAAL